MDSYLYMPQECHIGRWVDLGLSLPDVLGLSRCGPIWIWEGDFCCCLWI